MVMNIGKFSPHTLSASSTTTFGVVFQSFQYLLLVVCQDIVRYRDGLYRGSNSASDSCFTRTISIELVQHDLVLMS